MIRRPTTPRIRPVAPDERARALGTRAATGRSRADRSRIFSTLLRHPKLATNYRRFGDALRHGVLPDRDRELLVLRTAWRCRSPYAWGAHAAIATGVLTAAEIAGVTAPGGTHDGVGTWSRFERSLLRAVDELHDEACVSDETWAALAQRYDHEQLIELLMVVGNYHLLAFVMNAAGVQPEAGHPPLPVTEDAVAPRSSSA